MNQLDQPGTLTPCSSAPEPPRDFVSAKTCDTERYGRFFNAMLEAGVYLPPAQFEAMFVSLAHQQADFDATLVAARVAFAASR